MPIIAAPFLRQIQLTHTKIFVFLTVSFKDMSWVCVSVCVSGSFQLRTADTATGELSH